MFQIEHDPNMHIICSPPTSYTITITSHSELRGKGVKAIKLECDKFVQNIDPKSFISILKRM